MLRAERVTVSNMTHWLEQNHSTRHFHPLVMGHPQLIFILFCHFEGGNKRQRKQYLCVHIACVASHLFVTGGGPILLKIRMIMKFLAKTTTTPYRWQNVRAGPARTAGLLSAQILSTFPHFLCPVVFGITLHRELSLCGRIYTAASRSR